ncbi:Hypothetical protein PBC10988_40420 [Planctomycetales bacterium 10988]|nr:Hypothetical protein PBC10988_40420 [Planctomycetales bacterium 10988]
MAIRVVCDSCRSRFEVDDRHAGKKGPCPKCGKVIQIPTANEPESATVGKSVEKKTEAKQSAPPAARSASPKPEAPKSAAASKSPAPALTSGKPKPKRTITGAQLRAGSSQAKEAGDASSGTIPENIRPEDIKIHDTGQAAPGVGIVGKSGKRIDPEARKDAEFKLIPSILIFVMAASVIGAAVYLGKTFDDPVLSNNIFLGLTWLISFPLAVAGYWILRSSDDTEPYHGKVLLVRTVICGTLYTVLWLVKGFVPEIYVAGEYGWLFGAIPFVFAGCVIAFASWDFEPGESFLHFALFVGASMLIRWLMGLGWI